MPAETESLFSKFDDLFQVGNTVAPLGVYKGSVGTSIDLRLRTRTSSSEDWHHPLLGRLAGDCHHPAVKRQRRLCHLGRGCAPLTMTGKRGSDNENLTTLSKARSVKTGFCMAGGEELLHIRPMRKSTMREPGGACARSMGQAAVIQHLPHGLGQLPEDNRFHENFFHAE